MREDLSDSLTRIDELKYWQTESSSDQVRIIKYRLANVLMQPTILTDERIHDTLNKYRNVDKD